MNTTTGTRSTRSTVMAAIASFALLSGCVTEDDDVLAEESEITAASSVAGNMVTQWATIAADAIVRPVEEATTLRPPGHSLMVMAQVQLAVYDTLAAIDRTYEPFSYDAPCTHHVHRDAAIATAAYRVVRTRVPGRAAYLDAQYEATMAAIGGGARKAAGIALGEAVAAHYLALRANDNTDNTYTWEQPTPGPGVFEPVAAAPPVDYKMVYVPPLTFALEDSPSFFPPPPPALTSRKYTTRWTEVRDLGRADSTIRTPEQTQLALWTGENAFRWVARNQIELAIAKRLSAMDSARYLAFAFTAGADSLQSGMMAKYHYNFWRPFHAIPRADIDGNPATDADPTWAPLLNVNHPEYPAGHGVLGAGAMIEATRAFFRTDRVTWTVTTVGVAGLTQPSRTYTSLSALGADIGRGRVLAGLHFQFSVDAGRAQAREIVNHIKANFFHRRW